MNLSRGERDAPAVLHNFGSPITIAIGWAPLALFAILLGQLAQDYWFTLAGGLAGGFAGIAYWLYKPVNFFSDNPYAPKSARYLTAAEKKALGWLHTRQARKLAIFVAFGTASFPSLGALLSSFGFVWRQPHPDQDLFDIVIVVALYSAMLAGAGYHVFSSRALLRHWKWIQQNQPDPGPEILAKYTQGWQFGKWDDLHGTEYSVEMDKALVGRPGKGFWRVFLQILGGAVAATAGFNLLFGRVVEGRFWQALFIGIGGLLLIWISGRLLGSKGKRKASWDDVLRK